MINLSASGGSIIFTFQDNDHYLQNGTIEVPVNSLSLVIDNSEMATFKKSATNDIFISALYSELGMTKNELETWFKENAVGSTGGGGGDVTSAQVQTMIDSSISGKADAVSAVCSAEYVESSTTIDFKNIDGTVISSIDASDFIIDGMIENVSIETISGVSYLVIDFNTASGKEDIQIPLTDIFDPSNYYTKSEVDAALSGKIDTSAITSSITWASTDSQVPSAKAIYNERLYAGDGIDIEGKLIYATYRGFPGYTEDTFHPFDEDFYIKKASDCPDATTSESHIDVHKDEEFYTYYIYCDYENGTSEVTFYDPDAPVHIELFNIGWDENKGMFHVYKGFLGDEYEMEFYDDVCSRYSVWGHGESMWTTDAIDDLDARLNDKADTSAVTESIEAAVSGKVDTSAITSSVTSASTDSEIPTAKAVYDAIPTGGSATYSAGTNIDITNDTISCTLPISASGSNTVKLGTAFQSVSNNSSNSLIGGGDSNTLTGGSNYSIAFGQSNTAKATRDMVFGYGNTANKADNFIGGYNNANTNAYETAFGSYNNSTSASTTFGDSGNTLFSVGNGTSSERHNAFEIRQNGDIYLSLNGQDVKLQDQLGGGSITIDPTLDSGSTNPVANSAITTAFDNLDSRLSEDEEVTAAALNDLNDALANKLDVSAYTPTDLSNYYTKSETSGATEIQTALYNKVDEYDYNQFTGTTDSNIDYIYGSLNNKVDNSTYSAYTASTDAALSGKADTSAVTADIEAAVSGKQDTLIAGDNITISGNVISVDGGVSESAFTAYTASTDSRLTEDEEVTAAALNALNDKFGGLQLVKISQSDYDNLQVKDNNVLYIIIN